MSQAKLHPRISRMSAEDAHAAATVQVRAMGAHAVQLRIHPLESRPAFPVQVNIKARAFLDMLAEGYNRVVKAEIDGEVVGIAVWILVSAKKGVVEEGFNKPLPRHRTEEEAAEAVEGVDVDFRARVGQTSADLRNKTMGDAKYWYLALMVVDPAYQGRGIGQALLQWALDQADAESLEVYLESSDEGLRLYEKNGFEIVEWNVLADEKSEGGALKWPGSKRAAKQ